MNKGGINKLPYGLPWRISTVLIDIDGTLTYERNSFVEDCDVVANHYPQGILRDMVARCHGISKRKALEWLEEIEKPSNTRDTFYAIKAEPRLGVSEAELWEKCVAWQKKHLFFHRDGIYLVKKLRRSGFKLIVASTNSSMGIQLKLSRAKLADKNSSLYFKGFYGDDLIGCQKHKPEFYRRLLKKEKLKSSDVVMVGDNHEYDYLSARAAGITKVILVDRSLTESLSGKEPIMVNSLRVVPELLALK